MRNIKIFILMMIIGSSAIHAQTVTSYEYWFDNDYTGSVSYSFSGNQTLNITNSVDCSGINQGFHTLNLRAKDDDNKWSNTLIKYFYKGPAIAQNHLISGYEYWLDQQNTSRTFVAVNPDTLVQITGLINLDTLNVGFHVLQFRAVNLAGQWGNTRYQYFYKRRVTNANINISAYEYWLDNDYAQKTLVNVNPGSPVHVVELLDLSMAQDGFHTFNIRFKNESNQWSITRMQYFYKAALSASQNTIAGYEYWFDNDYANKIAENGYTIPTLNITGYIECGTLTNGFHVFQIRYKDASEKWSNTKIAYFYKAPSGPTGANEIVAYRYWLDTAYTNLTTVNLSNAANPYQLITDIELPVLTQGNHIFNIQFKDQVAWGSVFSQEFLYNFTGTTSNCTSQAGIMPASTIELCAYDFFNLNGIGGVSGTIVLDANDGAEYYLHTSPTANLGDVISHNSTGNFFFNPASMVYEQTYYVSQVVGNNMGTPSNPLVNLADTCLSVSIGTPVKWNEYPTANAGSDTTVCGLTYQLQASYSIGASQGYWELFQGPVGALASWSDTTNPNATVQVNLAGQYIFKWTEQNLYNSTCLSYDHVSVMFQELQISASITNVLCYGNSTGSISLTASGGAPPYLFYWNNGSSGFSNQNLAAGNYLITTTDALGCTASDSFIISQPPILTINSIITDNSNAQIPNGSINITLSGGVSPYSFYWSTGETTESIQSLTGGTYIQTITDNNNCIYGNAFQVENVYDTTFTCGDQITDYDGNLYNTVQIGNQCWMKENLRVTHYDDGSGIPYISDVASWDTLTYDDPAYSFFNDSIANAMDGAFYSWEAVTKGIAVNTANPVYVQGICPEGWHVPSDEEWKILEGEADSQYNYPDPVWDATSFRGSDVGTNLKSTSGWAGSINGLDLYGFTAIPTGTREPNGTFTPKNYYAGFWSSTENLGSYAAIRVFLYSSTKSIRYYHTKEKGYNVRCLKNTIDSISLSEVIINNICFGDSSGSIDLSITGGMFPYTYNWSNGASTEDVNNLLAGTYSVTVTDSDSNSVIGIYSISEPPSFDLNLSSSNYSGYAISCNGSSDGAIYLSTMGGVSPYSYLWNTGATSAGIYNLSADSYFITATDNNGCEISGGLTLNEPSQMEITTMSNDFNGFGIQCNGEPSGSISSTVSGGVPPYILSWSNGSISPSINSLTAGTYIITVADMNGCMVSASEIITEPDELILNTQITNVSTVGGSNGAIEMIVSGGVSPYTYYFAGYPSDSVITGLNAGSYFVGVTDANNCFYNNSVLVQEIILNANVGWNYTITGSSHSILISDSIPLTIDGITISNGDYIGVFYDSLGVLACGGYIEWTGVNTALTAWGDDNLTVEQDGFLVGEAFKWKIWQQSSGEVFDATATYIQPPVMPNTGNFISNGLSGLLSLEAITVDYQYINLPEGWSYFSTYIDPFEANIDSVLNPIVNSVVIAKDRFGDSYWPLYGVNMIGNIIIGDAYQVKMVSMETMTVEGLAVEPDLTPIVIPQGWSLIAYLRQSSAPIATMLSSLISDLSIVKNSLGNSYWPTYGVNTIVDMNPGEGYQFKMNAAHTLVYPSNSINYSKSMIDVPSCQYYSDITNTGNNMTLGIYQDKNMVKPGDEIAIYSKSGLLVGASVVEGDFTSVTIWGDDELSSTVNGMIPGEMYEIRVWDCNNLIERTLQPNKWIAGNNGYIPNKIAVVACIFDDNSSTNGFELYQNVPNPFSGKTEIKFYITEPSNIELDIYNVIGKNILHVSSDEYETGTHTVSLNLDHLQAGTYYYRLKSKQGEITRKMIKLND